MIDALPWKHNVKADRSVIAKIKACLARADASSNDNEHERAAALRQATRLMDEHNVSETSLDESDDPREQSEFDSATLWKSTVLFNIGRLNGCFCYRSTGKGKTYIIGKSSHRAATILMSQFVIASINREAGNYTALGRTYTNSFRKGAASGVSDSVRAILQARKAGETSSASRALVLVEYYKHELSTNKRWVSDSGVSLTDSRTANPSDWAAAAAGRRMGAGISLNAQLTRSGPRRRLTGPND